MAGTLTQKSSRTFFETNGPSKYNVIMHNDDETTMDFVVMVLQKVFRKAEAEAEELMLRVHNDGQTVVGTYWKDIAQSKANYAMNMARQSGFPLKLTIEKN